MGGNGDLQLIEELLLFGGGLRHTTEPDLAPVGRREDNVRALERREVRQGLRRREAGAAVAQQMFQCDPERVPEKRDEEMRLHASLELMEYRPDGQLTFQGAKGGLRFGQLDVLRPQLFDRLSLESMGLGKLRASCNFGVIGSKNLPSLAIYEPKLYS